MNDSPNAEPTNAKPKRPRMVSSWLIYVTVCVFCLAIAAAILISIGERSRGLARNDSCAHNLKQISLAFLQYTQEYDERLPPLTNGKQPNGRTQSWRTLLQPYTKKSVELWKCPENPAARSDTNAADGLPLGYDVVDCGPIRAGKPLEMSQIKAPTSTFLAFEKNGDNAQTHQIGALWDKDDGDANWTNIVFAGHLSTSNYLFIDGHVKSLRPMNTIASKVNRWNLDNRSPISPRALQKLQTAQHNFG